ncbi:MAG: hypothetical protein ACXVEF_18895, partial [Polyangiales bacterium]
MRLLNRVCYLSIAFAAAGWIGCGAASDKPDDSIFNNGDDSGTSDDGGGIGGDIGDPDGGIGAVDLTVTPLNAVVYIDTGKTPL